MNAKEAHDTLVAMVAEGWVVGVSVFGENDCCEHGENAECPSSGFGLCDQFAFNRRNPAYRSGVFAGSDCNRAEQFLMRPNDPLFSDELKALLGDQP